VSALPFDAQRAVAKIRRRLAAASEQLSEGFAQFVRDSSEARLERLMRSPLRRVVLGAIFWQMPRHVDREQARGRRSSIRWRITGRPDAGVDVYQLELADESCAVVRDPKGSEPQLTITVDGAEFLRLATGNSNPMQAYFGGRIALSGDIMLAARLASLFRIPAARR
jgi:alkyl sulfatase BDS1-like metallo-beta-lactamase superfamily hydrolase